MTMRNGAHGAVPENAALEFLSRVQGKGEGNARTCRRAFLEGKTNATREGKKSGNEIASVALEGGGKGKKTRNFQGVPEGKERRGKSTPYKEREKRKSRKRLPVYFDLVPANNEARIPQKEHA